MLGARTGISEGNFLPGKMVDNSGPVVAQKCEGFDAHPVPLSF